MFALFCLLLVYGCFILIVYYFVLALFCGWFCDACFGGCVVILFGFVFGFVYLGLDCVYLF